MTPYHSAPYSSNIDLEETNCRSCLTPTLYLDHAQGDSICTSCGLVHSQHYKSSLAEWRDYSAMDPDSSSRNVTARAGTMVDESRWAGGLEPTTLGRVYNPSGSAAYNNPELDMYRRKLGKVKRSVDKWVEKEFERNVEEGKVALKVKARMNQKRGTSDSNSTNHEEEDWTEYSTNEHEDVARLRIEQTNAANKLLVSEKWSLDRALLIHGQTHEIPSRYTSYNPLLGEQPKDIEKERHAMNKRMNVIQRKSCADLYCAYTLTQKALRKLDLCENSMFNNQVMQAICTYVTTKGGFKVKGVAPRITSDIRNDTTLYEQQSNYNKQRQMSALGAAVIYLECKNHGLGRAVKEICSSFELPNNCCGIEKFKMEPFVKQKFISKAMSEIKIQLPDYIKSITSNAKPAAKTTVGTSIPTAPATTSVSATATATTSATSSAISSSSTTPSSTTEHSTNQIEHIAKKLKLSPTASRAITKLVLYYKDNNLSDHMGTKNSALIASMIYLVCDAGTMMQRLSKTAIEKKRKESIRNEIRIKKEYEKKAMNIKREVDGDMNIKSEVDTDRDTKLLSIVKVNKEDDSIMSTTTSSVTKTSNTNKRKHIRPSAGRNRKRQRIKEESSIITCNSSSNSSSSSNLPLPDVTTSNEDLHLEPLNMISTKEQEEAKKKPNPSIMTSYRQWSTENSWHRSLTQITQSCNTTDSIIVEFYRKQLYPKRKVLLDLLQQQHRQHQQQAKYDINDVIGNGDSVLLSNIASVAPLMVAARK